jgi:pepF/M3 family oligoendopeptidase
MYCETTNSVVEAKMWYCAAPLVNHSTCDESLKGQRSRHSLVTQRAASGFHAHRANVSLFNCIAKPMTQTEFPNQWNLDNLFPNPATDEFRKLVDELRSAWQQLVARCDGSGDSKVHWESVVLTLEQLLAQTEELEEFVTCHAAADAENKVYQKYEAILSELRPLSGKVMTRLEFAMRELSDEEFQSLCDSSAGLSERRFFLAEARRNSHYRLPMDQESLYEELAVDGINAWGRLYDKLCGKLRVELVEDGKTVRKSIGQVRLDLPSREQRQANFEACDQAWSQIEDVCADAINHIAGTRLTKYQRVGLQDYLDLPLSYNRLQRDSLTAMWDAVKSFQPRLVEYLNRRARLIGVDACAWYDLDAPLPVEGGDAGDVSWDTGCQLIVDCFRRFDPAKADFAHMALSEGWVEGEDRSGKRQGGFCTSFPNHQQSRIFMTYTNTWDSVSTLAHELGHAWHSWVLKDQPVVLRNYPMNLAETASTFAEAVLARERMNQAGSDNQKILILDRMLSDAVSFLMNIHCRFLFESRFHELRQQGEVSSEKLTALMIAAQKEAWHDGLAPDGWNGRFWISKLHFYITGYPFYNFPYTFGYLLSLALFALADEGIENFPARYQSFLIATGCESTENAVHNHFGYNLNQPDLWMKAIAVIESRLDEFLRLTD